MDATKEDEGISGVPHGWVFDDEVTAAFPSMLEKSVPDYAGMRAAVFELGREFVEPPALVLDLGASRGDAVAPFHELGAKTYAIEKSPPMVEVLRQREEIDLVYTRDLREGLPAVPVCDLVLSVLSLMFVPVNYRQRILREVYEILAVGGALILVEKVLGDGARLQEVLRNVHHARKLEGYPADAVRQKELALEGVLVPLTDEMNRYLLRAAGFGEVDGFWRSLNFSGLVAVKRAG